MGCKYIIVYQRVLSDHTVIEEYDDKAEAHDRYGEMLYNYYSFVRLAEIHGTYGELL